MYVHTLPRGIRHTLAILIITISSISFLFAQEKDPLSIYKEQEVLSELQKQARFYRAQGLESQHAGNIDTAMSFYQKAIQLDPTYAATYNDLGIIYESKGDMENAEKNYLMALTLDPYFLSAYTNLALLYEFKRDFKKASSFWEKRVEFGLVGEYWTEKARKRLQDIDLVMYGDNFRSKEFVETEVIDLTKDVLDQKYIIRDNDSALSNKFLKISKQSYNNQDYAAALKWAIDAYQLDPANKEIEEFIRVIQARMLSK